MYYCLACFLHLHDDLEFFLCQYKARFLDLWHYHLRLDNSLFGERCPVHCRMFSNILDLYSLDASSTATPAIWINPKCPQTFISRTLPSLKNHQCGDFPNFQKLLCSIQSVGYTIVYLPLFLLMDIQNISILLPLEATPH